MRRVKTFLLFLAVLVSMGLLLTACGGGGGGGTGGGGGIGGGGGTGGGGTQITNLTQANQAASTGVQAGSMAFGSSEFIGNMSELSELVGSPVPEFKFGKAFKPDPGMEKAIRLSKKFSRSKALQKASEAIKQARLMKTTYTIPETQVGCTDGGSLTYSGTYDDQTGNFNLNLTFNNCREDGLQMNGPVTMSGSMSQSSMTMNLQYGNQTTNFTMLEFENNYATLVSEMTMNITLSMNLSQSGSTITMSSTMNGNVNIHDYLAQQDYSMTFNNFKEDMQAQCLDQSCNDLGSGSLTVNGGFEETWTEDSTQHKVALSYSNFKLTIEVVGSYEDVSVSGTVNVDFTPDDCFEGTYVFATITPIRHDKAQDKNIQGHITINGNTHIEWNNDGTLTVWYDANGNGSMDSDEVIHDHVSEDQLAETCDFQTFDEEIPESSGNEGQTTGNTMTITSKSVVFNPTDPNNPEQDLYCYTDIHVNYVSDVNYYNTPPSQLPQGVKKWYVDWHQKDGSNPDVNGDGVADFEQYLDITGDGIADVGLDINGSDYDITKGGMEHFTALVLPPGYYVISMNNYNCDPNRVRNEVTISIGKSSIFGPYTCTYTASDGEGGHNPGAWCAIADIVVDSNGNVTVQAHNPNLELWHDGAFGMYAPKKAKGLRK